MNSIYNKVISFSCNNCSKQGLSCTNYANNLISLYFDYWLSKVTIHHDPKGFLEETFDLLNFKRMYKGITPLILNYWTDDVITGNILEIKWDYNARPIGARVQISLDNYDYREIFMIHWKLNKTENENLKQEYLKRWGWNAKNVYEGMFFLNNFSWKPSLEHINKIIYNIHDLDEINDRNHCVINTLFITRSDKKPTPEQASNVGITFTKDSYGVWVVDWNENTEIKDALINTKVEEANLSKWAGIKDELDHWETKFMEYAGISTEKLSNQRENLAETISRFSRVSSIEKQYYKYIERFLKEYQEYFDIKVDYELDTLVKNVLNNQTQPIETRNKVKEIEDE